MRSRLGGYNTSILLINPAHAQFFSLTDGVMSCIPRRKRAAASSSIEMPSVEPVIVTIDPPVDNGYNVITDLKTKYSELQKDHEMKRELAMSKHAVQSHRNVIKQMREETFDGRFMWRLKPIDELFTEPNECDKLPDGLFPGVSIHSQPFYPMRYGYKMNLGCHINTRKNQITVYLTVSAGLYDEYLPWPLCFVCRLYILAPHSLPYLLPLESHKRILHLSQACLVINLEIL